MFFPSTRSTDAVLPSPTKPKPFSKNARTTRRRFLSNTEVVALFDLVRSGWASHQEPRSSSHATLTLDKVLEDPQVRHSGIVRTIHHSSIGAYKVAKPAASFVGTPCASELEPAPMPGEHNAQILATMGYP